MRRFPIASPVWRNQRPSTYSYYLAARLWLAWECLGQGAHIRYTDDNNSHPV